MESQFNKSWLWIAIIIIINIIIFMFLSKKLESYVIDTMADANSSNGIQYNL